MKILKSLWPIAAVLALLGLGTYIMSGSLNSVEVETEHRLKEAEQQEAAEEGEISIETGE